MIDPYIGPDGVFRNHLRITDLDELRMAEAGASSARLIALDRLHIDGDYDLGHLQAFHRYIFGDVYPWAGELRTVEIAKFDSFCRCAQLTSYAAGIFGRLRAAGWPKSSDRHEFVAWLAETYADINALHPFREGNGRAQRAFLRQFCAAMGRPLTWAGLEAGQNEAASIAGFRGDLDPLIAMLDKHVIREG